MLSSLLKKSHMAAILLIAALRGGLEGLAAQGAREQWFEKLTIPNAVEGRSR